MHMIGLDKRFFKNLQNFTGIDSFGQIGQDWTRLYKTKQTLTGLDKTRQEWKEPFLTEGQSKPNIKT